jgi:hypothetical protein
LVWSLASRVSPCFIHSSMVRAGEPAAQPSEMSRTRRSWGEISIRGNRLVGGFGCGPMPDNLPGAGRVLNCLTPTTASRNEKWGGCDWHRWLLDPHVESGYGLLE